jgi:hypothetical protein
MGNQQYERFRQNIGRFEIFLRGDDADVILRTDSSERNLTAQEALQLLSWLYARRDILHEVVRRNEQEGDERGL